MPDKTISLTFDDGPGPRTAELAEYLAAEGVHGTFFINGKNVPGRQGAVDTIVGRGHLLANHTQNHLQLTKLSGDKVVKESRRHRRVHRPRAAQRPVRHPRSVRRVERQDGARHQRARR